MILQPMHNCASIRILMSKKAWSRSIYLRYYISVSTFLGRNDNDNSSINTVYFMKHDYLYNNNSSILP